MIFLIYNIPFKNQKIILKNDELFLGFYYRSIESVILIATIMMVFRIYFYYGYDDMYHLTISSANDFFIFSRVLQSNLGNKTQGVKIELAICYFIYTVDYKIFK